MNKKIQIAINSTILYVIAFLLTTIFHEFTHAITGVIYNSDPIWHHNFVEHKNIFQLEKYQLITIALAGPLVSLIQGLGSGWAYFTYRNNNLLRLFLLWFSILGFNNFLGYIMTGPFFSAGDIGKVYGLLQTFDSVQILLALFAAGILLFIAYKITKPFLLFAYQKDWIKYEKSRKDFSFNILIIPWILGSMIITLLYLPIIAIVSIIYPIMSGFVFIYPWQNARRCKDVCPSNSVALGSINYPIILILLFLVLLFRLVLAPGISM